MDEDAMLLSWCGCNKYHYVSLWYFAVVVFRNVHSTTKVSTHTKRPSRFSKRCFQLSGRVHTDLLCGSVVAKW